MKVRLRILALALGVVVPFSLLNAQPTPPRDEIIKVKPDLVANSCDSGGRKIIVETSPPEIVIQAVGTHRGHVPIQRCCHPLFHRHHHQSVMPVMPVAPVSVMPSSGITFMPSSGVPLMSAPSFGMASFGAPSMATFAAPSMATFAAPSFNMATVGMPTFGTFGTPMIVVAGGGNQPNNFVSSGSPQPTPGGTPSTTAKELNDTLDKLTKSVELLRKMQEATTEQVTAQGNAILKIHEFLKTRSKDKLDYEAFLQGK